jgi:aspartyl-tRNA(Asn)/glutamyl-tRNA(Gln) amidotransferase subunit C
MSEKEKFMIDEKVVKHMSKLSQIAVNDKEIEDLKLQIPKILNFFNELSQVNTENIQPFYNPVRQFQEYYLQSQDKRDDQVRESLKTKELLSCTQDADKNQFRVQAVLEEEN